MSEKMLRVWEVAELVGMHERTVWRYEREGTGRFPKKKKLGPRRVAWSGAEIEEWIARRNAGEIEWSEGVDTQERVVVDSAETHESWRSRPVLDTESRAIIERVKL